MIVDDAAAAPAVPRPVDEADHRGRR